jgi:hypothetical protein
MSVERQREEDLRRHPLMPESRHVVESASMMNCSVWLLTSKVLKASMVTSAIAPTSSGTSCLIVIIEFMVSSSSLLKANRVHEPRAAVVPNMPHVV